MNRLLKYSVVVALAFGLSMAAHAAQYRPTPRTAPEVDPSLAIGGLALLGGTIAVLRARRSK